jgi:hypothetical protein
MDLLAELRGLFNAPTMTDQQALDRVRQLNVAVSTSGNATAELATAKQTIAGLQQQVTDLTARAGKPLDPEVLAERSLRVSERADMLAQAGFAPADISKLKATLIGPDGKPDEVMLARAPGAADCRAANVLNVLRECKPVPPSGHDAVFAQPRMQQQQGGDGQDPKAEQDKTIAQAEKDGAAYQASLLRARGLLT